MILNPEPPRVAASLQLSDSGISLWQLGVECLKHVPKPLYPVNANLKPYRAEFRSPTTKAIIRWAAFLPADRTFSAAEVKAALFSSRPEVKTGDINRTVLWLSEEKRGVLLRVTAHKQGSNMRYRFRFNSRFDKERLNL